MVSTLKVNKIQIPNSDSDVISLDASSGNVTLNKTLGGTSITVQGEGSATTNLQQGLVKQWMAYDHDGESGYSDVSGTTLRDSFNTSSVTDVATGVATPNFTNNMSNNKFSATTTSHWKGHTTSNELYLSRFAGACNFSTSAYSFGCQYSNGNAQDNYICTHVAGDLA